MGAAAASFGFYGLDRKEPKLTVASLKYADKETMLQVCSELTL